MVAGSGLIRRGGRVPAPNPPHPGPGGRL